MGRPREERQRCLPPPLILGQDGLRAAGEPCRLRLPRLLPRLLAGKHLLAEGGFDARADGVELEAKDAYSRVISRDLGPTGQSSEPEETPSHDPHSFWLWNSEGW